MDEDDSLKHDEELQSSTFVCRALHGYKAEEEHDLSFEEGDLLTITGVRNDGWWEAIDSLDRTGLVPSTFLQVPHNLKSVVESLLVPLKGRKNISSGDHKSPSIKNPSLPINGQDRLPPGFRPSQLYELFNKDCLYSLGNFMMPRLDASGLSLENIKYEIPSLTLKPSPVLLQRKISLIAARHISDPPRDFIVKSRHVRMCFHDGNKVLSNIHTVKAKWNESSPKLWMFNLKITSKDPCIKDGELFIKSNNCVPTLGILFELCISYQRNNGVTGEMCGGWAFIKLLKDSGEPIRSKTIILKVQDTVPFAAYLSHLNSPAKLGLFKKIVNKQKVPRIVVSISNPDRSSNRHISYLPSTLMGPWCCIPILALCRKISADDLLKRHCFDSTDRILSPLLANIPSMLNAPDILDILRMLWTAQVKTFDTGDVRMDQMKKTAFQTLFLETVFVILHSNGLPKYVFGDSSTEKIRKVEIERLLNLHKSLEGTLALTEGIEFSPLSIDTLSTRITL